MAVPLLDKRIIKKRVKKFKRTQSDRFVSVKVFVFCFYICFDSLFHRRFMGLWEDMMIVVCRPSLNLHLLLDAMW